jgi:hypothetical protein
VGYGDLHAANVWEAGFTVIYCFIVELHQGDIYQGHRMHPASLSAGKVG